MTINHYFQFSVLFAYNLFFALGISMMSMLVVSIRCSGAKQRGPNNLLVESLLLAVVSYMGMSGNGVYPQL
jgi:hypothetical protein